MLGYNVDQDTLDFTSKKRILVELTLDAAYPAGGYALDEGVLGVGPIERAVVVGGNSVAATLIYMWDHVNKKLMVLFPTGGLQAAPTSIGYPAVALVAGSGTPDDVTLTPGQGKEVGDGADLSTVVVLVEVIGKG